jgi:hypothetical protein
MIHNHEPDRIQCQAIGKNKKRCSRIATHSDGGKGFCETHVQIARRDRANAVPIKKGKP